jgi:predicted flap endonuclease-1-like 5' DNA nuclease
MLAALSEYWIYIAIAAGLIGLAVFLLTGDTKQHIDITDSTTNGARPTLEKGGMIQPRGPNPYPYKYKAPPRSPLPRDNLLVLKGVGPMIAARLDTFNFTRFEHIAVWKEEDYVDIAEMLGEPVERIIADRWVEQAKLLAAENFADYEAEYGKIDPEVFNRFKDVSH